MIFQQEVTANENRIYLCIDLKSFYASVECVERGLDPMTTNLVVADASWTEKTIFLAVSPALKSYGIPGRARLFKVVQQVKLVNSDRLRNAPGHRFSGSSDDAAIPIWTILLKSTTRNRMEKAFCISSKQFQTGWSIYPGRAGGSTLSPKTVDASHRNQQIGQTGGTIYYSKPLSYSIRTA